MIGRVIEQLNQDTDLLDKLHHTVEKLCAHAATFWPVIHFELDQLDQPLRRLPQPIPPRRQRINNKITGLGGTAKAQIELVLVFVEDATRMVFFLRVQIVIARL